MWAKFLFSIATLAYTALAVEPAPNGVMNALEKRDTADYCGVDYLGINWYCINSLCCVGNTGIWSCVGVGDSCCTTGFMCPTGTECYLDSLGYQWCVSGTNTVTAQMGSAAQTQTASGSDSTAAPAPTPTTAGNGGSSGGSGGTTVTEALPRKTNDAAIGLGVGDQWIILVLIFGAVAAPILGF